MFIPETNIILDVICNWKIFFNYKTKNVLGYIIFFLNASVSAASMMGDIHIIYCYIKWYLEYIKSNQTII